MIRCYKCGVIIAARKTKPCRRPNEIDKNLRRAIRWLKSRRELSI